MVAAAIAWCGEKGRRVPKGRGERGEGLVYFMFSRERIGRRGRVV